MEYKTVTNESGTEISGFNVTTKSGLIKILNNGKITTTSTLEERNATLTFVNYEFNQASNVGKSFIAKLMIQKEQIFWYHYLNIRVAIFKEFQKDLI